MKFRPVKTVPALIAAGVIALVCLVYIFPPTFLKELEWITYDWRVREAARLNPPVAINLGYVFIDDESIASMNNGSAGFEVGLYWPRHVYGRVVRELATQGARAVAFDIIFGELRRDHSPVFESAESLVVVESDDYFAKRMREAGNVILAATTGVLPPPSFRTNAYAIGDISAEKDSDGKLRRARAFYTYLREWHPVFLQIAREYDVVLERTEIRAEKIVLRRINDETIEVPLAADGTFDLADFVGDKIPGGMKRRDQPFQEGRGWQMGIVLAARELKLDLENAEVDLERGRIILRGPGGISRTLPVDGEGYFYIDWSLSSRDERLTRDRFETLLKNDLVRNDPIRGAKFGLVKQPSWKNKLVVIGSTATGNDLTDLGATPLEKEAHLMSKHWNVANSIILNRFIQKPSLALSLLIIVLLGALSAWLTWNLRALLASLSVMALSLGYILLAVFLYVKFRYWIPMVFPVLGALMATHVALVTYRVRIEQSERRRIKSIFSRMVSPSIVNELLDAEQLSLEGVRRELTIYFADIREFTEMTDTNQSWATEFVQKNQLKGEAAEACFDDLARETLLTVNLYLATIADMVKKHGGTLDKYIGDCVMAFWGAPTLNPRHASACVRAAIDAQRAIHQLNQKRLAENKRREEENIRRRTTGEPPLPMLPVLKVGTGINTGTVTVGLMGDATNFNYTVFGREVNLASRLESASGHGRILIGETTYAFLQREDPELAARCEALPPMMVKGIRSAVQIYRVPWELEESPIRGAGSDSLQSAAVPTGH